jgi:2-polyprenyl-6-methoxyphenol hydroxylase-like FAD-dependent oxidoreductase
LTESSYPKDSLEVPVLIIGAGPVGLALAVDLAQRNVPCMVVDKGDGVVRHSKMGLVSIRSMELCRRWGIADKVRNTGFPQDYALNQVSCTSLTGHSLGVARYPSMRDEPLTPASPEKRQRCPQIWFDPILKSAAEEASDVSLRYGCEMTGFRTHETHIETTFRDIESGVESAITASYLVGCDGASSTVRDKLGIEMEGERTLHYSIAVYFRRPDLLHSHDKGPAERYLFIGEEGYWGHLTAVDGSDYWRLTVASSERFDMENFDAAEWVARCLGRTDEKVSIETVMPWRRSKLVAEHFGRGRVLLCGDAVHVMSPTGGYGMNTGLCDAADLGWKLQGTLEGWGGPGLLDSYELERRPVGIRNTYAAADNFAKVMTSLDYSHVTDETPEGEAKRATIGPILAEAARGNMETLGISLGYRYEDSPLIVADGSPATADTPREYVATARPGHRAPHAWLAPGKSTLDLFGPGFVLLRFGEDAPAATAFISAARARQVPLSVTTIASVEAAAIYERRLVLVRPDGHVAWRGDVLPADALALIDRVRGASSSTSVDRKHPGQHDMA